jgi:hypothetical protein
MASVGSRVLRAIFYDDQRYLTTAGPTADSDLRKTIIFLLGVATIGIASIFVWALTRPHWSETFSTFGLGMLLAGSTALVGGVLRFLFGIPKSVSEVSHNKEHAKLKNDLTKKTEHVDAKSGVGEDSNNTQHTNYLANTNLEQVSDWLTKIIIGVSLTQIDTIRTRFIDLATFFGKSFDASGTGSAGDVGIAASILAYGLTAGFLAGYLLTRIFLPGAFNRADEGLRRRITALVTQSAEDRDAVERAGRTQGRIYEDLYRYKDRGLDDAIERLEELLEAPVNRNNPALWTNLAAAHGQAYEWEGAHNKNAKILKTHYKEALDAVRRTLDLGDAWRPILQLMWNKNHPVKKNYEWAKYEDDLEVFFDDPKFKKLLDMT